jgi:Tfp pilus assembly protein PilE
MYKKSRSYQLLLLCLFLTTHCVISSFVHQLPIVNPIMYSLLDKPLEEGFCAETLIKTQSGYELVENLVVGDIVMDVYGNPTPVVAITKHFVDEYIKLFLKDIILCVGCDQQFYYSLSSSWIKSREVHCENEHSIEPIAMYALTTHSHTLLVTSQDLYAHNAATIFYGVPSICCGYIAIINPVVAILGGTTIGLAVIAYNAYQMYLKNQNNEGNSYFVEMPDTVTLAERFYYEGRKEALEKLKKELITIKDDLTCIKNLCSGNFTYQCLRQHAYTIRKNVPLLSIAQEKQLSDEQKNTLRFLRENDLALLEKQVCDIQFLLALHVNQLIDNVQRAQKSYDNAFMEIQEAIIYWNNNLEKTTLETAFKLYRHDLLREHLVYAIQQASKELFLVAEYYRACMSKCIQSSTTIITMLNQIVSIIDEKKQWILQEEEQARSNSAIIERYFADHNVLIMVFKNEVKIEFEEQQKKRDAQILKKIETKQQVNSGFGGGPKKNDDEEEDEKKIEISEQDMNHIFRKSEGHFTKNTPKARKIIEDIVADKNNYNGLDKYGTKWYSKIISDGQQVWAGVRDGKIRYAGINKIPWPKDRVTGLLMRPAGLFKI